MWRFSTRSGSSAGTGGNLEVGRSPATRRRWPAEGLELEGRE